MKHNLFSVYQAAKDGSRTVFDWDESYIEDKASGERVMLERGQSGWQLAIDTNPRDSAQPAEES